MRRLEASYTVEAAMVMGIVLWTLGFLVQSAFRMHDTVTGGMILQETMENARHHQGEKDFARFVEKGESLGTPRLWLGRYEIDLEEKLEKLVGKARAGNWSLEIEMEKSRQEQFLRKTAALSEKWGGKSEDGG